MSWLRAALAVPLELKVLGANVVIVAIAAMVLANPLSPASMRLQDIAVIFGALAAAAAANYALIRLALKPVKDLERVARRVSEGRLRERVSPSLVADPDLAHLAATMNEMLDKLAAGRDRMRKLGAEVVYAQERERAQVARDLHDSVAQTLAAASFQIAAAANDAAPGTENPHLSSARELVRDALEELRAVSTSLHPRVADDLGLPAALEALADVTRQRALIDVRVQTSVNGVDIPRVVSTTLYRVAQEALRDVEQHGDAGVANVCLSARPGLVELEVLDDGSRADTPDGGAGPNPVLARMRERLSLAGGGLHIHSMANNGTRLVATARLDMEAA